MTSDREVVKGVEETWYGTTKLIYEDITQRYRVHRLEVSVIRYPFLLLFNISS